MADISNVSEYAIHWGSGKGKSARMQDGYRNLYRQEVSSVASVSNFGATVAMRTPGKEAP